MARTSELKQSSLHIDDGEGTGRGTAEDQQETGRADMELTGCWESMLLTGTKTNELAALPSGK
jgi:hypothetical protein